MLKKQVSYKDIEPIDPSFYKSLEWILENDITDIIDVTFSVESEDFGKTVTIDLIPNGRNVQVSDGNKHEYVNLLVKHKLFDSIKDQMEAFCDGFNSIIPQEMINIFDEQELELLISGLPDIEIDDWKANTVYQGYTSSSPQIQWFWRAVRSLNQEEKAKLLQFCTATSKVPLEGFASLQGMRGTQKFSIHKDPGSTQRLLTAHTW